MIKPTDNPLTVDINLATIPDWQNGPLLGSNKHTDLSMIGRSGLLSTSPIVMIVGTVWVGYTTGHKTSFSRENRCPGV